MRHLPSLIALLMCALVCAACGGPGSAAATATPPRITPTPSLPPVGTIKATISGIGQVTLSGDYYAIAVDDTAVWVHNPETRTLLHIDPLTNGVVATIPVGHGAGNVAMGAGSIWVLTHDDSTLWRISPQTNQVVTTIKLPVPAGVVTVSPGAVWVGSFEKNRIIRIDPQTNQLVATLSTAPGPIGLSVGAGSLWVCNQSGGAQGLTRLNPATNQIQAQIDVGSNLGYECGGVMAGSDTIWVLLNVFQQYQEKDNLLERIDPTTNKVVTTVLVPGNMAGAVADEQGVWAFVPYKGLFRVDSQTNQVVGALPLSDGAGVALGAGSVWLANGKAGTLLRIIPAP